MRRIAIIAVAVSLVHLSAAAGEAHGRWRWRRPGWSRSSRPVTVTCPLQASLAASASAPTETPEIVTPQGTRHRVIQSTETDPFEFGEQAKRDAEGPAARSGRWDGSDGVTFVGLSRRAAKTSISGASMVEFDQLSALLSGLPEDDDMRDGDPDIEEGAGSNRVDEEDRNVSVAAFFYAASREDDNDFHPAIGDDGTNAVNIMDVEISGLPMSGPDRGSLEAANEDFANVLNGRLPGSRYAFYDPPIPVQVTGSLFYDVDYPPRASWSGIAARPIERAMGDPSHH
jgi:hypothetical protein